MKRHGYLKAAGYLLVLIVLLQAKFALAAPEHLDWASAIALHVTPDKNAYASGPSYIRWPGVKAAMTYENHSVCSSFITLVLKQAYHWGASRFENWLGSASPSAASYHDAVAQQNGFYQLDRILDVQPGDLIAIKYPSGLSASGHVMLANSVAIARKATPPLIAGTKQYKIQVIDSSRSGHGAYDTRRKKDGTYTAGAGIGILRIYAGKDGSISGYTWSTEVNSVYYDQNSRPLAIGRLQ